MPELKREQFIVFSFWFVVLLVQQAIWGFEKVSQIEGLKGLAGFFFDTDSCISVQRSLRRTRVLKQQHGLLKKFVFISENCCKLNTRFV